ncbi:hypothetical protein DENIS_4509 [Desulfonema ishimotonii]|uniref:YtxH domain-containing protein n=1 Tax=Desulfonema ishimotonii TaxID=45657 RepID=A0A401G317_9BACT|nr:YtxH domain-containing protein [Desulfonema ishimotonii]GBC63515.1 hypothetical protein DENIS_4509 [Desulfonema ishimotonii]
MSYQTHPASYAPGIAQQYSDNQAAYYAYNQNYINEDAYNYGYAGDGTYLPQQAQMAGPAAWFNFSDGSYLKGFLVGAAVTLVVANPTVQKTIVRGAVKIWSTFQGGLEEVKENIQDVKAEMSGK